MVAYTYKCVVAGHSLFLFLALLKSLLEITFVTEYLSYRRKQSHGIDVRVVAGEVGESGQFDEDLRICEGDSEDNLSHGLYALWFDRFLTMFHTNLLPPSSGWEHLL
jgi:hypothetical protein